MNKHQFWNKIKSRLIYSPNARNAVWIVGGKVAQMLISLVISMLTARYLGPTNFGLISYSFSYIAFFSAFCTLGINSILVKEFIEKPDRQGEAIGTTLILRGLSSFLSVFAILIIVSIIDRDEPSTVLVVFLCSIQLLFSVFDTFDDWYQSKLKSKIPSIARTIAVFLIAGYKVFLLITKKSVKWFAISASLDFLIYAIILGFLYFRQNGQALTFSKLRAIEILKRSYNFILSGIMVSVYVYIDRLMIKQMLTSTYVGYYSVAVSVSTLWTFVLSAIIDSMRPTIMVLYEKNKELFYRRLTQLYSIVVYLSFTVSFLFLIFSRPVIALLYGVEYLPAVSSLRIVTWSTAFSYLGVVRNIWIVCDNKQRYLKYIYFVAAFINVLLNLILISLLGITGAAISALLTQICTSIVIPSFYKEMRKNNQLILDAFTLKGFKRDLG